MKVLKGKEAKTVKFEDLGEGETFRLEDEEQIEIKTDEGSGCCLEDGILNQRDDDEKVIRVNCELRVLDE